MKKNAFNQKYVYIEPVYAVLQRQEHRA